MARTRQAPIPIDHRAIDDRAVNDDRHARLAGYDDHRTGLRARRRYARKACGAKSSEY